MIQLAVVSVEDSVENSIEDKKIYLPNSANET